VFERGSGNGPWLWWLWMHRVRFVVRWKKGNKLIDAAGQERKAWDMVLSYVRRWKIEDQVRFQKTELLIASLRLRDGEPRRKLLLLLTLAYGLLLSALSPPLFLARSQLLAKLCQRADWRLWTAKVPLSPALGVRSALARPSSPACGVAALPSSLSHYKG
jgi:hypothetical protein